jgi:hypothetical protein
MIMTAATLPSDNPNFIMQINEKNINIDKPYVKYQY